MDSFCWKFAQFRRQNETRLVGTTFPWYFSLKVAFWLQKMRHDPRYLVPWAMVHSGPREHKMLKATCVSWRCKMWENQTNSSQRIATWILKSEYKDCKDCNAAKQGRSSHSHDIYSSVKGHCRDNKDMASALLAELGAVLWVWSSMRNTCIQSVLQFWIQLFVNTMKLLYKLPFRACVTDLNNIQALKGLFQMSKLSVQPKHCVLTLTI